MTLTFAEFQATKRSGNLRVLLEPLGIDVGYDGEEAVAGLVYADGLYIMEPQHPEGRYELILGNADWLTDDLVDLERRLYEFGCSEGYIDNPDAPTTGEAS